MSMGVKTKSASGAVYFDSSTMPPSMAYQSIGLRSSAGAVAASGITTAGGICTPTTRTTVVNNYSGAQAILEVSASGSMNAAGTSYAPPAMTLLTGQAQTRSPLGTVVGTPSAIHLVGIPSVAGTVGLKVANTVGFSAYDSGVFYVHPTSSGQFTRFAFPANIPSNQTGGSNNVSTYYDPTISATIVFDQAFTDPPLIFVISTTSGGVALNYMSRDANGKYISAHIVCPSLFSTKPSIGSGYWDANSGTIEYFIASPEIPVFGAVSTYGLKTFGPTGALTFDSSRFVSQITAQEISTPHVSVISTGYSKINTWNASKATNQGICINNLNAASGIGHYASDQVYSGAVYPISYQGWGPVSIFGRFLTISGTSVTVQGNGTTSFVGSGMTWGDLFNATMTVDINFRSYDFHIAQSPTTQILKATYTA